MVIAYQNTVWLVLIDDFTSKSATKENICGFELLDFYNFSFYVQ